MITINENENSTYEILAHTKKYAIVFAHGKYRIENLNGIYVEEVPHLEITKDLAEHYLNYLFGYNETEPGFKIETKTDRSHLFDLESDKMIADEHSKLYPEECKIIII